jgi:hypothetical protein
VVLSLSAWCRQVKGHRVDLLRVPAKGHDEGVPLRWPRTSPERVAAVLAVDPLGGVADGGCTQFEGEMFRRTPEEIRERAQELDDMVLRGAGTEADALESFRLVWRAYFPSWDAAPQMLPLRLSVAGYAATWPPCWRSSPGIGGPAGDRRARRLRRRSG